MFRNYQCKCSSWSHRTAGLFLEKESEKGQKSQEQNLKEPKFKYNAAKKWPTETEK